MSNTNLHWIANYVWGIAEFRNQIPRLAKSNALGTLIEKLTSPDINLSPAPVLGRRRRNQTPPPRQPRHGLDL